MRDNAAMRRYVRAKMPRARLRAVGAAYEERHEQTKSTTATATMTQTNKYRSARARTHISCRAPLERQQSRAAFCGWPPDRSALVLHQRSKFLQLVERRRCTIIAVRRALVSLDTSCSPRHLTHCERARARAYFLPFLSCAVCSEGHDANVGTSHH